MGPTSDFNDDAAELAEFGRVYKNFYDNLWFKLKTGSDEARWLGATFEGWWQHNGQPFELKSCAFRYANAKGPLAEKLPFTTPYFFSHHYTIKHSN